MLCGASRPALAGIGGQEGNLAKGIRNGLAVLGIAIFASGCGGAGGGLSSGDDRPTFLFLSGSPDGGSLDFYIDDRRKAAAIGYGTRSASPIEMSADDYDFDVRRAGDNVSFDTLGAPVEVNKHYLVGAFGKAAFGADFMQRLRLQVWQFDRTVPNGDKARLLVLNGLVPEAGFEPAPIDFQDGVLPQFKFDDLAFGGLQSQLVDTGTFTFEARTENGEAVFVGRELTFERGKIYLALVTGIQGQAAPSEPRITLIELPTAP